MNFVFPAFTYLENVDRVHFLVLKVQAFLEIHDSGLGEEDKIRANDLYLQNQ